MVQSPRATVMIVVAPAPRCRRTDADRWRARSGRYLRSRGWLLGSQREGVGCAHRRCRGLRPGGDHLRSEHVRRARQVQRMLAAKRQRGRKIPDLLVAATAEAPTSSSSTSTPTSPRTKKERQRRGEALPDAAAFVVTAPPVPASPADERKITRSRSEGPDRAWAKVGPHEVGQGRVRRSSRPHKSGL